MTLHYLGRIRYFGYHTANSAPEVCLSLSMATLSSYLILCCAAVVIKRCRLLQNDLHSLITLAVPASSMIFKDSAMTSKFCFPFCLVLSSFVSVSSLRLPVNSVSYTKSIIGRQSFATRCFATSGFIKARGLLTGIVDVSNVKDYSREINLDDAADLLRDNNYLHNIALAEAHGNATECKNKITEIIKTAKKFMANRDDVWDRDELKRAMQDIIADRGKLVCLLGGKSTGKSLVIRNLEKLSLMDRNMGTVFVVNQRVEGSDILTGLIAVLEERRKFYLDLKSQGKLDVLKSLAGLAATFFAREKEYEAFSKVMIALVNNNNVKQPLKVLINELLTRVEGSVTLVIDEANIGFTITQNTKEEKVEALKGIMAMLTQLTKESGKLNVIFASSEHAFPYRLGHPRVGFNMVDLTGFIVAGEVPPNKMYELLTTKWGVGRNLAAALIDLYGGHVYDILLRLEELNSKAVSFVPGSQMQADNVLECLKFNGDKAHMRELLTQIAENGFAALSTKKDREAEVISKYNVGGLVQKDMATVIGLPDDVWVGEIGIGLIPSKQSIRLVIAKVLHRNPEVVNTGVVSDLKSLSPTDEQLIELTKEIEEIKAEIKASIDPEEKKQLRKKEEQLRKKEEQLREKELILLRRQDGSDR